MREYRLTTGVRFPAFCTGEERMVKQQAEVPPAPDSRTPEELREENTNLRRQLNQREGQLQEDLARFGLDDLPSGTLADIPYRTPTLPSGLRRSSQEQGRAAAGNERWRTSSTDGFNPYSRVDAPMTRSQIRRIGSQFRLQSARLERDLEDEGYIGAGRRSASDRAADSHIYYSSMSGPQIRQGYIDRTLGPSAADKSAWHFHNEGPGNYKTESEELGWNNWLLYNREGPKPEGYVPENDARGFYENSPFHSENSTRARARSRARLESRFKFNMQTVNDALGPSGYIRRMHYHQGYNLNGKKTPIPEWMEPFARYIHSYDVQTNKWKRNPPKDPRERESMLIWYDEMVKIIHAAKWRIGRGQPPHRDENQANFPRA